MTTYLEKAIGSVSAVLAGAVQLSNIDHTCNLHLLTYCAFMALAYHSTCSCVVSTCMTNRDRQMIW